MEYPSESTDIPIEIIEHIIDDIEGDIAALISISQTCHTLLQSCRKRLFRSVDLTPHGRPPAKNFRRLLQCNPDIGLCVRELNLYISVILERWVPGEPNAGTENIRTLTQIPFLEKLYVLGGDFNSGFLCTSWKSLQPTLRQPILDHIRSPSLTELRVSYFTIPVTIFRSCVNISALTIMAMSPEMPEPIDEVGLPLQPTTIPQLRSFTFQEWSDQYASALVHSRGSDGLPTIRFDKLKTLIAHCYDQNDVQAIKDIFKEAAELETFVCMANTSDGRIGGLSGWINVSAFGTLKTLRVVCNDLLNEGPLDILTEELELFPLTNVLEVLEIEIHVGEGQSISTREEQSRLDVLLSRGFSRLKRVSIDLSFRVRLEAAEISERRREFERISRKQFPWLWKAPIYFYFSTSFSWFV